MTKVTLNPSGIYADHTILSYNGPKLIGPGEVGRMLTGENDVLVGYALRFLFAVLIIIVLSLPLLQFFFR